MSYGEDGGELDLRPIHLACLSGGNGQGKSTLVDAITWALWGRSRAAREDDLLRQGTTEMEVELVFASGGACYRVIRKRVLRRSASAAVLELAVLDGDTYRAITGATIAETERQIADMLHLSYETFINSSLLLQGRADLFTTKKPAERKEVLAEILGLQRYEALADRARERERLFRQRADAATARVADLDRILADLPALYRQRAAATADLEQTQSRRLAQELLVTELEVRVRGMSTLQESLLRLRQRLGQIDAEEAAQRTLRETAAARIARVEELLGGETAIRARLSALHEARIENDRFTAVLHALRALEVRCAEQERAIAREEERLGGERTQQARVAQEAQTAAQSATERRVRLAGYEREIGRLPDAQRERERLVAEERRLLEETGRLEATNTALEAQRKELRKRIEGLRAAGAACPVCGSAMDEAQRTRLHDEAMAAGLRGKAEILEHAERIAVLGREREALQRALRTAEAEVARIHGHYQQVGALEQELRQLEAIAARLGPAQAEMERLGIVVGTGAFALDQRQALRALQAEIDALGYDPRAHQALQARIRDLAPAEQQRAALEQAHEERHAAQIDVQMADLRLATAAGERARLQEEQAPLVEATRNLPALQADLTAQQRALTDLRAAEGALQQLLGRLHSQIEDGDRYTREREVQVRLRDEETRHGWAHHELAAIFGRRGIQAMLIENALPELEQDANDLLARMTDNSTQVSFVTRRESKAGSAVETLEIRIADTMGTRAYELFSGGEAFRINLAVRIALSKLLARRAGADLSFLLIDEGFGSQDAQARDRLVQSISAIAADFQKILVVTHIDELKDQFDVHVEVSKGPGGSQIAISAA